MRCSTFIPADHRLRKVFGKLRCHLEGNRLMIFCDSKFDADVIETVVGDDLITMATDYFHCPIRLDVVQKTDKEEDTEDKKGILVGTQPLNAGMTFDTFVGGRANREALSAAVRIASMERTNRSMAKMLYIYGGYGLGKTHLLHATVNDLLLHDKKVLLYTGSSFASAIIDATRQIGGSYIDQMRAFHDADVLAVDDITFVKKEDMPRVTVELKQLLDYYLGAGKCMLFTGEYHPTDDSWGTIPEISSRLLEGLVTKLDIPDRALRYGILAQTFHDFDMRVDDHIISYLADAKVTNIRALQGIVKALSMTSSLGTPITIGEAKIQLDKLGIAGLDSDEETVSQAMDSMNSSLHFTDIRGTRFNKETRMIRDRIVQELVYTKNIKQVVVARALKISPQLVTKILHRRKEASSHTE